MRKSVSVKVNQIDFTISSGKSILENALNLGTIKSEDKVTLCLYALL
jgi:hypothetical protein